jgi:hypothetical protein
MENVNLPEGTYIGEPDPTPLNDEERQAMARDLAIKGASRRLIEAVLNEDPAAFAERTGFPLIEENTP